MAYVQFIGIKWQGMSIKTYIGHGQEVHDVAIAEDNSRIASVGGDKLVLYWVRSSEVFGHLLGKCALLFERSRLKTKCAILVTPV